MREPPNDRRGFIHKRTLGALSGFITGGPSGAVSGFINRGQPTPRVQPLLVPTLQPASCGPGFEMTADGRCRRLGVVGTGQRLLPGGASGFVEATPGMGCPSGSHPNRSSYMTMSDGFVEKGTKCVPNRRRNPLNPRAARRSMSRLTALSKEMSRLEKTLRRIAPRR